MTSWVTRSVAARTAAVGTSDRACRRSQVRAASTSSGRRPGRPRRARRPHDAPGTPAEEGPHGLVRGLDELDLVHPAGHVSHATPRSCDRPQARVLLRGRRRGPPARPPARRGRRRGSAPPSSPCPTLTVRSSSRSASKACSSVTSSPAYRTTGAPSSSRSAVSASPLLARSTEISTTSLPCRTPEPRRSPRAIASSSAGTGHGVLGEAGVHDDGGRLGLHPDAVAAAGDPGGLGAEGRQPVGLLVGQPDDVAVEAERRHARPLRAVAADEERPGAAPAASVCRSCIARPDTSASATPGVPASRSSASMPSGRIRDADGSSCSGASVPSKSRATSSGRRAGSAARALERGGEVVSHGCLARAPRSGRPGSPRTRPPRRARARGGAGGASACGTRGRPCARRT